MSAYSNALAQAYAARANKPCVNALGQKGRWSPDGKTCVFGTRDHRAAPQPKLVKVKQMSKLAEQAYRAGQFARGVGPAGVRVASPGPRGNAFGPGGRIPAPVTRPPISSLIRPGTAGGQVAAPSVVALNCGAGQQLVNGACQAVPGSSISPTTGTIAQPNQGATAPPTLMTRSGGTPPGAQSSIGPAPDYADEAPSDDPRETTPSKDERSAPPAAPPAAVVEPQGMSTGVKVAIGAGAVVAAWLILRK